MKRINRSAIDGDKMLKRGTNFRGIDGSTKVEIFRYVEYCDRCGVEGAHNLSKIFDR
jgi:hypothetical protein